MAQQIVADFDIRKVVEQMLIHKKIMELQIEFTLIWLLQTLQTFFQTF